jgi:hypothetical protein
MGVSAGIPDLDGCIIAATGEHATIGRNGKSLDVIDLPGRPEQFPTFYVLLLDGSIPTASASIGAKDKSGYRARMGLPGSVQDLPAL